MAGGLATRRTRPNTDLTGERLCMGLLALVSSPAGSSWYRRWLG